MNKKLKSKLVCTVFLGLLLTSSLSLIKFAFAPTPGLTLKWVANLGGYAKTYIAPLSVNINGRTEIITTGSNQDYGTAGLVTALDGKTGNIIWQVQPGGIGSHTPFEISDINNDGVPEIVISAQGGALCLFANNGSTYWKNRNAPAEENYPAIADVNNDGYDEVFVCRGYGPYNGFDYITELSYNGTILHQTYVWHPCWGGLTVGDPNFNGHFMLFCGDRSYAYGDDTDPYQHGGMGIRALDAATLTPLWNDSDILCSSQAPMLADVDKDGKLDVVVAWQARGGMAVLNATDGTILTTGGVYRGNSSLGLRDHSNPTVGHFDNSGDMESITAQASNPVIFDLYTWQVVATLPITCQEPPKAGHVTADGALDIIAISGVSDTSTIFEYNNATNQFVSVQNITGLLHANAFSLVQDVDGDGLNELVLTSGDGNVFCYDTPATASTPPVRTGYQFSSDRHDGVAEYVPPAGPIAPQIYQPSPQDGATNVPTTTSQLSFKLRDYQGNPINYTVTTSPNVGGGGPISVYNGTFPTLPTQRTVAISGLQSNTTYTWTVVATDGQNPNTQTYTFTTEASSSWWDSRWKHRNRITITPASITADQTDFPVLIDITNSDFSTYAQSNGNDFAFTDSNQIQLNHEIESYNSSSGHLIAWVKIPSLLSSQNTVLYLYYDNPSAKNQQKPSAVWDQNFMIVQHLEETTGQVRDSTANANNGSPHGGVSQGIAGKIDGADVLDGSTGYIEIPASNTLAGYAQGFTISLWLKFNDVSRRQTILNKFNTPNQESWFLEYSPSNGLGLFASQDGATYSQWHALTFKPTVGTWYSITVVWTNNSLLKFYVNGAQLSTAGNAVISQIYNNIATSLLIGNSAYTTGRAFSGTIDQIELSNIARTTGWIQTGYNIESNPSTIYTLGASETR